MASDQEVIPLLIYPEMHPYSVASSIQTQATPVTSIMRDILTIVCNNKITILTVLIMLFIIGVIAYFGPQ